MTKKLSAWIPNHALRHSTPLISDHLTSATSSPKYQRFLQITILGTSCERPPFVGDCDYFSSGIKVLNVLLFFISRKRLREGQKSIITIATLLSSWIVQETEISQWEVLYFSAIDFSY